MLFVMFAHVLIGCSQSANNSNNHNAAANTNRPATTTSSPATTIPPASTTAGGKIGVPECDDFIAKYDACVSGHVPHAARLRVLLKARRSTSSSFSQASNGNRSRLGAIRVSTRRLSPTFQLWRRLEAIQEKLLNINLRHYLKAAPIDFPSDFL